MYKGRAITVRKAVTGPDFTGKTVLVADPWEYVDLWLRRQKASVARFYWEQARDFAQAAASLPLTSSPLPAYYCLLNAAKALLTVRKRAFTDRHGVTGQTLATRRGLNREEVVFKSGGVLPALCTLLGERAEPETHTLRSILYNLAWIHRAYVLTYRSTPELFVPLQDPAFVWLPTQGEAWFQCTINARDMYLADPSTLPKGYEKDEGSTSKHVVRMKKRFRWKKRGMQDNLKNLRTYHSMVRKQVAYIHGPMRLWYLKRSGDASLMVEHSSITLTFAAMHRLSELSRYNPRALAHHLDASYNWLLSEFITIAPRQFVDEIASEITGQEFMVPGTRM
jgi:hypothetical protein